MQWTDILKPPTTIAPSPLFISTSLTVGMIFDPIPRVDVLKDIEQAHDIMRGKRFLGKVVVIQDQEVPRVYVGGVHAKGPLVEVALATITLREARGVRANDISDKYYFSFTGDMQISGIYGAPASAQFELLFKTEAAFWAFVSLLPSDNMFLHQAFQLPGLRYRDAPTPAAPTMPMPRWGRAEIFLVATMLGLLPLHLILALLTFYFSLI